MSAWTPFDWFSGHWTQLTGWSIVVVFLSRMYKSVSKFMSYVDAIDSVKTDIVAIRDNHLTHLQLELESVNTRLEKVNENLEGMRTDIRSDLIGLRDDMRAVLVRMR